VDTFHSYMQYRFWHRTWWPKWHGPASFFLKSTTYLTINGSCWFWWTCRLWLFKLSFHNIHWHQSNFASLMLIGHKTFHNNVNKAGNSVMKRKFKQWLSTILSISKNEQPSHTSQLKTKWPCHKALEFQILAWDRIKNVFIHNNMIIMKCFYLKHDTNVLSCLH
jgi:hypothetical protein